MRTVKRLAFKLDAQDNVAWLDAKSWATEQIRKRGYDPRRYWDRRRGGDQMANDAETLRELLRQFIVERPAPATPKGKKKKLEHGQTRTLEDGGQTGRLVAQAKGPTRLADAVTGRIKFKPRRKPRQVDLVEAIERERAKEHGA